MDERRQYVRLDSRLQVEYTVVPAAQPLNAATKDVSVGGMRVEVTEQLEPGTQLAMTLTVPGGQRVPLTVEVVSSDHHKLSTVRPRARTHEVGIRIVRIEPKDREILRQYVSSGI